MTGDSNKVNFIYLYGAKAQANYTFPIVAKNVAITNNTVSGIARLAELRATENVTITGNVATNLYKEFAQFSNDAQNPATYAGDIVISDNNVDTIEGFFVVIGNAGDAKVVVKNNTIVNCGRSAEYPQYANLAYTKINSIADGNEPVIENNKVS